jgi:hypothetical protein
MEFVTIVSINCKDFVLIFVGRGHARCQTGKSGCSEMLVLLIEKHPSEAGYRRAGLFSILRVIHRLIAQISAFPNNLLT